MVFDLGTSLMIEFLLVALAIALCFWVFRWLIIRIADEDME